MKKGMLASIGAYLLWGILPIFWKSLQTVPAGEILLHRMVWSLAFLLVLLSLRKQWRWLGQVRRSRKILFSFLASALLLTLNWYTYIYAVNNGHIVEASLGYFINPLLNVLLGVFLLREHLRRRQWLAIAIAGAGVIYLTFEYGHLPWIALILAFTFALYGLLRKTAALGSLAGLSLEMMILFLPAVSILLYLESAGAAHFGSDGPAINGLLIFTGLATTLPLLLFAYGAQRVRLSTIGILQYIAPTLQFLLGIYLYHESFTTTRLIGFICVWTALIIYTFDGLLVRRQRKQAEILATE